MLDRADTEAAIYRVGVAALAFYNERPADEPGYTIDEDIDWCMHPLAGLAEPNRSVIRGIIAATITDPTAGRQALVQYLARLSDG